MVLSFSHPLAKGSGQNEFNQDLDLIALKPGNPEIDGGRFHHVRSLKMLSGQCQEVSNDRNRRS